MENQKSVAKTGEGEATESLEVRLEKFQTLLNKNPDPNELDRTPDNSAYSIPISYVEMALDELFFGQWSTRNFKWSGIANEVQGALELVVYHPVSGRELVRTGAGSITIMVDKIPDEQKKGMTKQQINEHALNPSNKKSNALDLAFPKLKAECLKNAANSLGKFFGRDINRKKADIYRPMLLNKAATEEAKKNALNPASYKTEMDIRKAMAQGLITSEQATELALQLHD